MHGAERLCPKLIDFWPRCGSKIADAIRALPRSMVSLSELHTLVSRFGTDEVMKASPVVPAARGGCHCDPFSRGGNLLRLGEMRGYNYHTGLFFAAYSPSWAKPLPKVAVMMA